MSDGFWPRGATWIYQAAITNDGTNAGNHVYTVLAGEGNEFEILYGSLFNGDTVSLNGSSFIDDGTNRGPYVAGILSIGAGAYMPIPSLQESSSNTSVQNPRLLVSGPMRLVTVLEGVNTLDDSAFFMALRIYGGQPTVTLTSPTDATEVVNTDRVV